LYPRLATCRWSGWWALKLPAAYRPCDPRGPLCARGKSRALGPASNILTWQKILTDGTEGDQYYFAMGTDRGNIARDAMRQRCNSGTKSVHAGRSKPPGPKGMQVACEETAASRATSGTFRDDCKGPASTDRSRRPVQAVEGMAATCGAVVDLNRPSLPKRPRPCTAAGIVSIADIKPR